MELAAEICCKITGGFTPYNVGGVKSTLNPQQNLYVVQQKKNAAKIDMLQVTFRGKYFRSILICFVKKKPALYSTADFTYANSTACEFTLTCGTVADTDGSYC